MTEDSATETLRSFRYEALSRDGAVVTGSIRGVSDDSVRSSLRARGLLVAELAPGSTLHRMNAGGVTVGDLAVTLRVLATLLASGLPAGRAVQVAYPLVPDRVRAAMLLTEDALRDGAPLSLALATAIPNLPASTLGILQAGEAGGDLAFAFEESARVAEESQALRQAIIGALAYPALLAGASVLVVVALTTIVIPRFAVILTDLGQSLPLATRLLLSVSAGVRVAILPAAGIAAVATLASAHALRQEGARTDWHSWLLTLPLIGAIRHSLASSRATAFLASALATGLAAPRALALAAGATGDHAVRARIANARHLVIQGRSMTDALRSTGALTEVSLRLIGAGEIAGSVVATLRHASALEGTAARLKVQGMLRIIEPSLIISFGGLVAFVAVALLQAVYSVRPGG